MDNLEQNIRNMFLALLNMNNNFTQNFAQNLSGSMNNLNETLSRSMNERGGVKKVMKKEVYESLKRKKYKDEDNEWKENNKNCPITDKEYEDEDTIIELECGHKLIEPVAERWFKESNQCPYCRKEFEYEEESNIEQREEQGPQQPRRIIYYRPILTRTLHNIYATQEDLELQRAIQASLNDVSNTNTE